MNCVGVWTEKKLISSAVRFSISTFWSKLTFRVRLVCNISIINLSDDCLTLIVWYGLFRVSTISDDMRSGYDSLSSASIEIALYMLMNGSVLNTVTRPTLRCLFCEFIRLIWCSTNCVNSESELVVRRFGEMCWSKYCSWLSLSISERCRVSLGHDARSKINANSILLLNESFFLVQWKSCYGFWCLRCHDQWCQLWYLINHRNILEHVLLIYQQSQRYRVVEFGSSNETFQVFPLQGCSISVCSVSQTETSECMSGHTSLKCSSVR